MGSPGGAQRGLLLRHSGGCLSPRVLDFLCFDTPRSVLGGEDGEAELPFFLAARDSLEQLVAQGALPCPALWTDAGALAAGAGTLRVLYRLGGSLQHCELPGKPLRLQPVKQTGGTGSRDGSATSTRMLLLQPAVARAYVSSRRHTQMYRVVVGLFPKLEQLNQELLSSDDVELRGAAALPGVPPGPRTVWATPLAQGVVLERLSTEGDAHRLTIIIDFQHACLVLREGGGAASTPDCLRSVNSLAEALAVLHRETGRLGPSLTASPAKGSGRLPAPAASPAKPPLPAAHGVDALRVAVDLVQACTPAQLREGLAILSTTAGNSNAAASAVACGALEALVTAAATVLPGPTMGMAELQSSLSVAVASLLNAAPPAAYAAGRLVSILAAVLRQSCASPLLLCRVLVALLERADVRAEAMRQGLVGAVADMYSRLSPAAAEAAATEPQRRSRSSSCAAPADQPVPLDSAATALQQQLGFGSPLVSATAENAALNSSGRGQVASLVATYNALSDSGSDCSPSASRSGSPVKATHLRSPSALSNSSRLSVPRLALPTPESPTAAAGGLTRSTRRMLSGTPGSRARSPSPYGSPSRRSGTCDSAEPSALAELATLASALGESLMAADLPAIVAHKRLADVRLGEGDGEGVPQELLEPPPGTAKKVLEAHRILVTARSLRSVDSSISHTTDNTDAAGCRASPATVRFMQDAVPIKCLLLRALVAALPLLESAGWPVVDLSPTLAAEVVGLLGKQLPPAQEELKQLAVQALLRLSQRPAVAKQQRGSSGGSDDAGAHVLVAVAGRRLTVLAADGRPEGAELQALLQLLTNYTSAAAHPSVAAAVVRHCLPGLQSLTGVLMAGGLDVAAWSAPAWQLLHSLVLLAAAACRKCEDAEAGRGLLALLLADQQVASMLSAAASHMLLGGQAPRGATLAQRTRAAALQRDLLQLFAALAGLAGRQPPCVRQAHHGRELDRPASRFSMSSYDDGAPTSRDAQPGPGQDLLLGLSARRGLTRRHALQFFSFLVTPHSGLVQRILDHDPSAAGKPANAAAGGAESSKQQPQPAGSAPAVPGAPASTAHMRLRQGLLELLKAVFEAPGSPFADDKFVSDYYIRFHFIQFLKLYHNPARDHQALFLCRQHMDILLVLAASKAPHIRHRFHQLSVVDFFVRELSLEFEAKQPARGRMRLSSTGSQLDHRRTSSASTFGGMESGTASPTVSMRLPTLHEPEQAGSPVPLLRLPSRSSSVLGFSAEPASGTSSPNQQLPPGIGGRGLAVPRLNLGSSLSSPGGQTTPSPRNSARHGRPPLPPSARGATPQLTSRLGRTVSARSSDAAATAAAASAAATSATAAGVPPLQLRQHGQQHAAGPRPPSSSGIPKLGIPKLGLAGISRSLSAGSTAPEPPAPLQPQARPDGRAPSRVHFSPAPSRMAPSEDEAESESDSSDDEQPGAGGAAATSDAGRSSSAASRATPVGLDVPVGFTWTGDVEEDLDRLEAWENRSSDAGSERYHTDGETESPSASPTIPALRSSPFQVGLPPVPGPPLLAGKSPLPVPALALGSGGGGNGGSGSARGPPVAVPRLDLSQSQHSTLEARNAVAELQLAADAEAAKKKQGRNVLGELERSALGKGKVQAASTLRKLNSALSDLSVVAGQEVSYSEERGRRLLYRDEGLHLEVLQLVFALIFSADGQLDRTYCDMFPWDRKLQNIPFVLYHHLNHEENRPLLPHLLPRLAGPGGAAAPAQRLLRVLCAACFRPEWYSGRSRISSAVGAFSTVYRASLPAWAGEGCVVLKLVETPKFIQDRCAQVDVQGEVGILEALSGCPCACQLYDYGVDPAADSMFLVLKDYRCSLKQWRERQPAASAGQLRLYYAIFAEVAAAAAALLERGIVHFDLKCDNCLLEALPGVSESEFWAPSSERLPFRVVLADFGESKHFTDGLNAATTSRARGTDAFKSPEMLTVGGGASADKEQKAYDRRRAAGVGPASDVWSLGCLLYELVTGKLLFSDTDWARLAAKVTSLSMPLIPDERAAPIVGLPGMLDLLQYMLVRDPRMRPTLPDVQGRLSTIRSSTRARLPPHVRGAAAPLSSRGTPGGLSHAGSQVFSPTSYVTSPKAIMPMPFLAAVPLSPALVLAPAALLSAPAALKQHAACRVVLLFSPANICPAAGQAQRRTPGGALSPASSTAASSWDSSPVGSRGYGGGEQRATPTIVFNANPVFSPGGSMSAAASSLGGRTPARTLMGTPRTALRFASPAVHPEPVEGSCGGEEEAATPPPARRRSSRVHPESPAVAPAGGASSRSGNHQASLPGLNLPPPPSLPGSARGLGSGRAAAAEAALLQRVLADSELSAAVGSCNAAGVECRLAAVRAAGAERGMHTPLALAQWLSQHALPLLHEGLGGGGLPSGGPVLLAVQAGCEAEGAMAAVAHLMQHRQLSLYHAMVAASQWSIDLHLRQQHLLALQHWAATDGPTFATATSRGVSGSARGL